MKKTTWVVTLVLVLVLVLGLASLLAACGGGDKTTTTAVGPTTSAGPATTSGPAKPVELKFSTAVGVKYSLWGSYLLPWTDAVMASSNGLVTITNYPDNTLVKEEQQYDALLDGTSDITTIALDYNPGTFPIAEVSSLPLVFPNPGTAAKVFSDILTEYCQDEFKDVQILGVTVISASHYAGTKQVKVPADFVGMRLRTGSAVETDVITALGATPVEIATGDMATSMERKMADGAFLSWAFMFTTSAKDWAKDWTECDLFYRCFVLAMNKDKWNSLAPEQQQAFLDNSGSEKSAEYSIANDKLAAAPRATYMDFGSEPGKSFYTLTAEDRALWKAAMAPVYQKWVDNLPGGIDGQAVLDRIAALVTQYGDTYATPAAGGTTETTVPAGDTGIFFTDQGNSKVLIEIVPGPGMKFGVSTEGGFASKIEGFDAAGKSLGLIDLPDAALGVLDYSAIAGLAKIIVTDVPHGNVEYEYLIP
jgi:TRAP-type C4-dicarboxylate transport system substrate-binding protein